jgi:serine/threonine protein kinase
VSDATASGGRLGRYHLVEPIGGGANGEVHRAKVYGVAGFERQFAVKKFFPHVALNSRFAQALSAAARAYGSLEHPRIAKLAEFGVSAGHTFTATELVPGLDAARLLTETLASGVLIPAGSALSLVSQAARAVGYAHGRGISHLGVAPTNLIISPDGEVKITDIGILGACMPERPAHDGRFTTRVHYLAPEQITGEPASAATDVFALGVIAYELVTGERAFVGMGAEDVAQAILSGQPREPQLPRPIMRVLQRCLARSPFERFPDARALADALDAALRVSPVPGTRVEVAELVAAALQRIAELHDQQLSGALSLNLPTSGSGGYPRSDTVTDRPSSADGLDLPTMPFNRESAEHTLPELKSTPATTMQGMAPPPIAVPQGVAPPRTARGPAFPGPHATLQGLPPARMPPRPVSPPPIPRPVTARTDVTDVTPVPPQSPPRVPGARIPPIAGPGSSGKIPPLPRPVSDPGRFETSDPTIARRSSTGSEPLAIDDRRMTTGEPVSDPRRMTTGEPVGDPRRMTTGEPVAPPPPPPSLLRNQPSRPPPPRASSKGMPTEAVQLTRSRTGARVAVILFVVAALIGGSLVAWQMLSKDDEPTGTPIATAGSDARPVAAGSGDAGTVAVAAGSGDAGTVAVATIDGAAAPVSVDAAKIAAGTSDAASAVPPPSGVDAATAVVAPDDKLVLESKPRGARVFLDGADQGSTPVTLPGSADRHSLALVLPGHAPYIAEIDGRGKFTIDLEEVTPTGGPAGIKVKCKETGRYVVFLDGKPTGQLCPTERLEVELGEHLIEVYDLVTETRRQFPAMVRETRLSFRVKVD